MFNLKRLFAPSAAILAVSALGACGSIPFGGDIVNSHIQAAGIGYGPVTGVTAGYLAANHTFVPAIGKNANGNLTQLNYAGNCGRVGPAPVSSIQSGAASATATMNGTSAPGTTSPSLQVAIAVNQGLLVGEPATLDELAKLQAAAGSTHAVLNEYNACPQATSATATGAATSTPIP